MITKNSYNLQQTLETCIVTFTEPLKLGRIQDFEFWIQDLNLEQLVFLTICMKSFWQQEYYVAGFNPQFSKQKAHE